MPRDSDDSPASRRPIRSFVLRAGRTPRGQALREQAERIPEQVVARLGIEVAELEDLHRALTRVIAAAVAVR
jgi:hypothetical protein